MKKIIVTGGAGFIGSHLCKKLLANNNKVICVDNFCSGSEENIEALENDQNFHFIEHDIIQPLELQERVDQIYNLACPASPVTYQRDPVFTTRTCFNGVINMLNLALEHSATFLQASTSEVYGDPNISPQSEKYNGNVNPIGIRACYDEGKRVAETLIFDYQRKHSINVKVARIFNTYGPNMQKNDGRVISNFIVQALSSKKLTVYGDGCQTRSFCYVSDLVNGLYLLMNSDKSVSGPINLGNPTELKIIDTAKKILELTSSKTKISFNDLPQDDPLQRKPDIKLAGELLNWSPKVALDEGLAKTIQYFRSKI